MKSQSTLAFVVAVSTVLAAVCVGNSALSASTAQTVEATEPALRRLLAGLVKKGAPSAVVFVGTTKGIAVHALGSAAARKGRPVETDQVWRIASVTKMVTAVVTLQLVREGRLALNDPLAKHLPAAVPDADRITIRHLLNHTSGIADYLAVPGSLMQEPTSKLVKRLLEPRTYEASLELANRHSASSEPGLLHEYSNTNYLLLGRIIERVAGRSYARVVSERVIEPLGLRKTGFPAADGAIPSPHLKAFLPSDARRRGPGARPRVHDVTQHTFFLGADGGLYSSGPDLIRLLDAIWRGPLLTDPERRLLIEDMQEDHDGQYRYGLGVAAFPTRCGELVYGHEGHDLGSFTMALTDRSRSRHVVLVFNRSSDGLRGIEQTLFDLRSAAFCGGGK